MQNKNIREFVIYILTSIYDNAHIAELSDHLSENIVCSGYAGLPTTIGKDKAIALFKDGIKSGYTKLKIEIVDIVFVEILPKTYSIVVDFNLRRARNAYDEIQKKAVIVLTEKEDKFSINTLSFEQIAHTGFEDIIPHTGLEGLLRKELVKNKLRFDTAVKHTGLSMWEYNIVEKCIYQKENSIEMHGFSKKVPNVPTSLVESKYVHPDSAQEFLAMYEKLFAGEKEAGGVFRVLNAKHDDYWWEKITYVTEFDDSGKPISAIGFSTDISEYMEMKKQLKLIDW